MFANPFPFCYKTISRFLALSVPLIATQLTAAPIVSNLNAAQRAGSKLVDVRYDVASPGFATVAVSLQISSDGGATWMVPVTSVSGAIGSSVASGTGKVIVWDAGADWPHGYSTQMRFRVTADDGYLAPENEDDDAALTAYHIESTALVNYPLKSGESYAVGLKVIDSQTGSLALIDGTVTLGLMTIDWQPVGFIYSLSSTTFPVVQGVVEGSVIVSSAADLVGAFLAVTSLQIAPVAPKARTTYTVGLASANIEQGAFELAELFGISLPKRLEDYSQSLPWVGLAHPLSGPSGDYPISGSFGEWRAPGRAHDGLDLVASPPQPPLAATYVRAIAGGVVSWRGGVGIFDQKTKKFKGGQLLVINHGNGYCSRYLHIDPIVEEHQVVAGGQVIGTIAAIGAPHLHLEIRENCYPHYCASQPGRNGALFQTGQLGNGLTLGQQINPALLNKKFTPALVNQANDTKAPRFRGLNFFANHPFPSKHFYKPAAFDGIRLVESVTAINPSQFQGVIEVVDTEATARAPYVLAPRSLTITESLHPSGNGLRTLTSFAFEREPDVKPLFAPFLPSARGGYALPNGKTLAGEDSYPFWFEWDTNVHKDVPSGPRKLTFTAMDWMDQKTEYGAIFGPEFATMVPPQSVPEESVGVTFDVKIKAHLGPYPDRMLGFAMDRLELSFRGKTDTTNEPFSYVAYWKQGSAEEVKTRKLFTGANAATAAVEETLKVRVVLKSGVQPPRGTQILVLRASSGNFPDLAHELEVKLGPISCDIPPIAATPPPAPAGFSLIPGGNFTMGRTSGDTDSDAPSIRVTVSPFYIQQTEMRCNGLLDQRLL